MSVPAPPAASGARIARAQASQAASRRPVPNHVPVFVPLEEGKAAARGLVRRHALRGRWRLESARTRREDQIQDGTFSAGVFQVLQSRRVRARGLTDLKLRGGNFKRCARAGKGARAAGISRRAIRRLRGNARGRFRTTGRNSSATVRGTIWEVIDRCDGTLTRVKRGRVVVRDFRREERR